MWIDPYPYKCFKNYSSTLFYMLWQPANYRNKMKGITDYTNASALFQDLRLLMHVVAFDIYIYTIVPT